MRETKQHDESMESGHGRGGGVYAWYAKVSDATSVVECQTKKQHLRPGGGWEPPVGLPSSSTPSCRE